MLYYLINTFLAHEEKNIEKFMKFRANRVKPHFKYGRLVNLRNEDFSSGLLCDVGD